MCRIESFSCYRGRKEASLGTRAIPKTSRRELSSRFFPARQGAERNSLNSDRNIRGIYTIICYCQNWVTQFKRGDFSICDAPRPGRPKTLTIPEIVEEFLELILEDRRISAKSKAEQLGISR